MALNYVTVTETFDDGTGTPIASGSVTFTPSSSVYAAGVPVATPAAPIAAQIINGALKSPSGGTLQLLATDNAGLTIEGLTGFWYWTATVNIGGAVQSWSFFLPHTPATVDLYALTNTSAGSGGFASPMTTLGDIIYENATPAAARLAGDTSNLRKFLRTQAVGGVAQAPAWDTIQPGDVPLPMTTLGDTLYENGTPAPARLPGNTSASRMFLRQQGTGSASAPPAWDTLQIGDVPYQPWQFRPESYGALGNGKLITDATIAGGALSTLTSASAAFTSADTGKSILVAGAGVGGKFLATMITFVNATTVTLAIAATAAVTNAGALYGTDDTAAVQSAVNAAVAYAQGAGRGYGEVRFANTIYCIAGAPVTGSPTFGNAQITLPVIAAASGLKVSLGLIGAPDVDSSPGPHWLQTTLSLSGTVLACMRTDGAYSGTNGPTSIIGGPYNGFGGGLGNFSNMELIAKGITFTSAFPGTYCGLDLYGVGQCWIPSLSYIPLATVPSGTAWPQINSNANQYQFLLRYPTVGNNDRCDAGQLTAYGCGTGIIPNEHATCDSLRTLYCYFGIQPGFAAGTSSVHGCRIGYWSCEATQIGINFFGYEATNASSMAIRIQEAGFEAFAHLFDDPNGIGSGEIWFDFLQATNHYFSGSVGVEASTPFRIFHANANPGPLASPQAPPNNNAAWFNGYYRDAWITLSVTGGSLSALLVDSADQILPSGCVLYQFLLPAGHYYTPSFTGTLTHKVTLL